MKTEPLWSPQTSHCPPAPAPCRLKSKSNEVVVASADTVAVDVKAGAVDTPMVAVLKPDAPTQVVQVPAKPALPPSKTVNLDTVDYDQTGNIVFGGRGPAGSKVQLYVDNNAYGLADINDKGTWSFAGLSPLTVGPHALRADEIGGDGVVKSRIEMPFYREEPAKVATAPVAPQRLKRPSPSKWQPPRKFRLQRRQPNGRSRAGSTSCCRNASRSRTGGSSPSR